MARVLIVDDDRAIRELLQIALELEGYETLTFRNGRQMIDRLASAPVVGQAEDQEIILMDLMMPEMDGWAVCRYLAAHRELLAQRLIVLMSAEAEPGDEFPALAQTLLCKPFDLDHLLQLLASLATPASGAVDYSAVAVGLDPVVAHVESQPPVALLAAS